MSSQEKVHWWGSRRRPRVGDRVRCGIPVLKRYERFGLSTIATRRIHGGDIVAVPGFLADPNRCRNCGALLRQDTGLLAGGND